MGPFVPAADPEKWSWAASSQPGLWGDLANIQTSLKELQVSVAVNEVLGGPGEDVLSHINVFLCFMKLLRFRVSLL